jgi:sugar phosphate isomerase/epimerase
MKAKNAGYDGVEANLPTLKDEQAEMFDQLKRNGLIWIGQHFESASSNFEDYYQEFETRLKAIASAKPLFINSQTGKDYFTFDENCKLIELATKISAATGVTILHETHRGKFSFCAATTAQFLKKYPDLIITADFSHWCCVSESYLQDQKESLNMAINRTNHFHARVGYPGGPQVNNPAAPEWKEAIDFHCEWWDAIVNRHLALNKPTLTITCEFGPYPYMPQLPFSQKDVSDLWEVNLFMKSFLEKRYKGLLS